MAEGWNDEYLIGPRIFCFAAGWVTAYVDVSPPRIEGAKDVSGLARHRLSRWQHGFGRGGSVWLAVACQVPGLFDETR